MFAKFNRLIQFSLILCMSWGVQTDLTPLQMAESVADKIYVNKETFFHWEYGNAVIFDALYESDEIFHMNYTIIIESYLDKWLKDPDSYGYKILNKQPILWDKAVGDGIGLFTINYLNRLMKDPKTVQFDRKEYMQVVETVVKNFTEKWPHRLPDGTFSRHEGWEGQVDKNASFVWADDQYMGLTLLARYAVFTRDSKLAENVGNMALNFAKYLQDGQDGLSYHGYNNANGGEHSCCKWGRANGWGMMSHVEVLNAVEEFPELAHTPMFEKLKMLFVEHSRAIIRSQSLDGRWHQVVDQKDTFLETSVTSMTLYALARGVLQSWLPPSLETHGAIRKAYEGLKKTVAQDGAVSGICMGTGIGDNLEFYKQRPTLYLLSSPGIGSVLHVANYMELYLKKLFMDGLN